MMEKLAQVVRAEVHAHPCHYIYHHVQSCSTLLLRGHHLPLQYVLSAWNITLLSLVGQCSLGQYAPWLKLPLSVHGRGTILMKAWPLAVTLRSVPAKVKYGLMELFGLHVHMEPK